MTLSHFVRYELRTTDVNAARDFYAAVFGPNFWGTHVTLGPLPERAAARGAPAHWVGHIAVTDALAAAARFAAMGGAQLGPPERMGGGPTRVVVKDPLGAVVALNEDASRAETSPVAWHVLNVTDHERASTVYASSFGWVPKDSVASGIEGVEAREFAYGESGPSVGSLANTARLPQVHTHWMLHFAVKDCEQAAEQVRALGGKVVGISAFGAAWVAACDDPQGAAFGLWQARKG